VSQRGRWPDEGKSDIATALARKAGRITTHDGGLIWTKPTTP